MLQQAIVAATALVAHMAAVGFAALTVARLRFSSADSRVRTTGPCVTALVWTAAATATAVLIAGQTGTTPVHSPTGSVLAWTLCAVTGLGAALVACLVRHRGGRFAAVLGVVGSLTFVSVTGAVAVGLDHDWATDARLLASLALLALIVSALAGGVRRGVLWLLVGVVAAGQLVVGWQQLAGSAAGGALLWLGVAEVLGAMGLVLFGGGARTRVAVLAGLATLALAGHVLVDHVRTPRLDEPSTTAIAFLGYPIPPPATIVRLVSAGRPNLLWAVLAVVAVAGYAAAVVTVRRRGEAWPWRRLAAWTGGWAIVAYLALTGLWEYSTVAFSWHMLVHMTVNMAVPALCVLAGPLTLWRLAARRSDGGARLIDLLDAARAWGPVRVLCSAPVLWIGYVGALFAVYYSPLFAWLMRYHWAHQLMLLAFMVTGYCFFNLLVGVDGTRRSSLPHLARLALLISIMPFHAVFAVGIMSSRSLLGAVFYEALRVPWISDLMADQNVGGQISWFLGEVPLVIVVIALAAQWFTSDKAEQNDVDIATDAGDDDSFDAYNAMLAELERRDRLERHNQIRRS